MDRIPTDRPSRCLRTLPKGATKINLNQSSAGRRVIHTDENCYDMMYWSIKFGVSIERLIEAISKVGPEVMNVERHLSAGKAVMPDASAAKPDRYVAQPHCLCAAEFVYSRIVQPDPTVFLVRNDKRAPLPASREGRAERDSG
jgi:hypothetical protein